MKSTNHKESMRLTKSCADPLSSRLSAQGVIVPASGSVNIVGARRNGCREASVGEAGAAGVDQ